MKNIIWLNILLLNSLNFCMNRRPLDFSANAPEISVQLDNGGDPNRNNHSMDTNLGHVIFCYLYAPLRLYTGENYKALHRSCCTDKEQKKAYFLELIKLLLDRGANPNKMSLWGKPLNYACVKKQEYAKYNNLAKDASGNPIPIDKNVYALLRSYGAYEIATREEIEEFNEKFGNFLPGIDNCLNGRTPGYPSRELKEEWEA